MRSLRYKRMPGTTKAIITETRKTDLPCHEIGRLVAASLSKPNEDRCVYVALPLLICRFLGQSFGGSSSCPHPRLTHRHAKPGGRRSPRSARHRRGDWWSPPAHQCLRQDSRESGDGGGSGWGTPAGQDFELRHKTRADPVADEMASRSSSSSGAATTCKGRRMALGPRSALRQSAAGKHR